MYKNENAFIIYFADHGDEANDYQAYIGRKHLSESINITAPCLHCQLDIPFIIYMTPLCREKHPDLVKKVAQSIHRPFMTDDLPHLLLDIANIETPWFNYSRSVINERYNLKRKRLIYGNDFSNPIDYDFVCDKFGSWSIGFN